MKMKRLWMFFAVLVVISLLLSLPLAVMARTGSPAEDEPELVLFTDYPSQVIGFDESPTIKLTLRSGVEPQIVELAMDEMPEGWMATFRGGATVVRSVYVEPEKDASVNLKLEPPADVIGGTHRFVVAARSERAAAELALELMVQERVPTRLALEIDLPTVRGAPSSTFRYNVQLNNEGDEEISVNLLAEVPAGWDVTIKLSGQEVTNLPLEANATKSLSVEAKPFLEMPAGTYPIVVRAEGGGTSADLALMAEVTGEANLNVTAPDGRLSGRPTRARKPPSR